MSIIARIVSLFRKASHQKSEDVLRHVRRQIPSRLRRVVPRQTVSSIRERGGAA